jgi:hypothetical protein
VRVSKRVPLPCPGKALFSAGSEAPSQYIKKEFLVDSLLRLDRTPLPWPNCVGARSGMTRFDRSKSVSKNMRATYDAVVALTDEVCHEHLDVCI